MKKNNLLILIFLFLGIGASNAQFTDLLNFSGANGSSPYCTLTLSATGTTLYGMTYSGGANNKGCIFSVNTNGTGYRDLWDFDDTGTNGSRPYSSLILSSSGNVLYGTTEQGGPFGYGNVFSIDTDGTKYKDLWDFDDIGGSFPLSSLTLSTSGAQLYGMTHGDQVNSWGNIFSIDTNGAGYNDLYDFPSGPPGGSCGVSQLVLSGKVLYGMTIYGGEHTDGMICAIDTDGTNLRDLWDFYDTGTNGSRPYYCSFTLLKNRLYGMTTEGGANREGLIFSIDTNGNGYKDIWDFSQASSNGEDPFGSLLLSGSTLYGLTYEGGTTGYGIMFSVDTNGTSFSDLWDFNSSFTSGVEPYNSLILGGSVLYGTASSGGAGYDGTVFSYQLPCGLTEGAPTITANVLCNGGSTGNATANPSNGVSPYTYSWVNSNRTVVSTSNPTGAVLSAGTYTVTVRDANSCSATASVTITQPNALDVSANAIANVSCDGDDNGSASSNISGGTSPYTYSWTPSGGTNANASSLSVGTYTVTVHDACGGSATGSAIITQPNALGVSANAIANVRCRGGNNGSASSNISGGTSPYTYSWKPSGGTNANASSLSVGTYTVTVHDACGGSATGSAIITQPNALDLSADVTLNVNCYGESTGSASSTISGGTSPYTYSWSGGGNNPATSNLSAGTYTVTVNDACSSSATASVNISQPAVLTANAEAITGGGGAEVIPGGGTSPYTYSWSPGDATNDIVTGLSMGTYSVTVSDAYGCTATATVDVTGATGIDNIISGSGQVIVYPNPNNGIFTLQIGNYELGIANFVEIYNVLGEKVYDGMLKQVQHDYEINISSQPNGVYLYRVITEDGSLIGEGKIVIQK